MRTLIGDFLLFLQHATQRVWQEDSSIRFPSYQPETRPLGRKMRGTSNQAPHSSAQFVRSFCRLLLRHRRAPRWIKDVGYGFDHTTFLRQKSKSEKTMSANVYVFHMRQKSKSEKRMSANVSVFHDYFARRTRTKSLHCQNITVYRLGCCRIETANSNSYPTYDDSSITIRAFIAMKRPIHTIFEILLPPIGHC